MNQVFARCHYSVFLIPGFFEKFYKFIGHFKIEQTIEQSYDQVFDIWFMTDKVKIEEGQRRQVDIMCTLKDDELIFEINKF